MKKKYELRICRIVRSLESNFTSDQISFDSPLSRGSRANRGSSLTEAASRQSRRELTSSSACETVGERGEYATRRRVDHGEIERRQVARRRRRSREPRGAEELLRRLVLTGRAPGPAAATAR